MGVIGAIARHLDAIIGPGVMLLFPLYASMRAIESPSTLDDQQWLTYWVLYSLITLFELSFWKVLQWFPFWPYMKLVFCMWLVLPIFNGAAYIYANFVRKYIKVGGHVSSSIPDGQRKALQMLSLDARKPVERFIENYGPDAFDRVIKAAEKEAKKSKEINSVLHYEFQMVVLCCIGRIYGSNHKKTTTMPSMETENSNVLRAEEIKLLANEAFKAHKYSQAIDLYTQAIELHSENTVYWANCAIAYARLEEYGSAIQDASRAIEVDPKYSKGYYRRGAAHLAMGKFKEALKDFQQVKKICPNDLDATKKLKECEKAVMKLKFEEAIAVPESERRSIVDSIDFHSIEVEPQYDGARIEGDFVTLNFVKKMMDDFRNQKFYTNAIYLSRGNHESKSMNKIYGFEGEVRSKLSDTFVEAFAEVFCCLPLAHVINEKVFIVHGGLFSVDGVKLSDIRAIDRFCEPPEEGLMCELLWSDPQPQPGRGPSKRGVGLSFGGDVTKRFLQENKLDLVVRSHEVKDEGYEIEHDGKLITVFSAPNYCDQMGNKGAFIRFEAPNLKPNIVTFSAVPHPDVKPMAYANNFLRMFS
ncbi:Serine/threonine-protein phosphatase 5 [Camellia lanceoleosa]|uniref:Serine/threonine-protein phosphatase 5 n=1 Tax=Camellia lanceoleosa TaxID=1840588 RepID=A0ACC0HB25_9ERIC|nr:Serine/threonine-protein phosphatase 5 [Camellia lanceoleosa]